MGFVQGRIEEDKLFGDLIFPKTLLPPPESESDPESVTRDLAEMVRAERESLSETLHRHGAILFRGFHVSSAVDFERVVQAFGWDPIDLVASRPAATRVRISDRVYTANEAPLDLFINFHHEKSLEKQLPSKIFFFCSEPAPEGGETSIIPSHVVVGEMEERLPEVMAKLSEVGLVFRTKTVKDADSDSGTVINKTWKWFLKTDDEVEGEKRARERLTCTSVNFNADGSAEFVYGPMNPIREFGGKRAWITPILGFTDRISDVNNSFGDGSMFPEVAISTYRKILEEKCVDVKWQKGDVLLVDNLAVQHARRPGKPPRVILVSMCQ